MEIDFTEIVSGEEWELLARDFLAELELVIETPPGRGPDAGKDILVSEQLRGLIATTKFTWLVSCKNFARRGAAVGLDDETNILERVKQHNAQGFMGFYSTLASSALIQRLQDLTNAGEIERYEIFDARKIEARFIASGFSKILLRYCPSSYTKVRPIQKLFADYEPLECEICGRDVLKGSVDKRYSANVVSAVLLKEGGSRETKSVHVVCKGECDRTLQARLYSGEKAITLWEDVGDLMNPLGYIRNLIAYTNILHRRDNVYTEEAHEMQKRIYISLAQCTLREASAEDQKRVADLISIEGL